MDQSSTPASIYLQTKREEGTIRAIKDIRGSVMCIVSSINIAVIRKEHETRASLKHV
jgi:hypothetical protein